MITAVDILAFIAQLVWAAVVLYAVTEIAHTWKLGLRMANAPQLQDTGTHRTGTPLHRDERPTMAIVIPDDLEALALRESEAWARDDMRTVIKEKYREHWSGTAEETWQRVRRAMGIGEMP